MTCPCFIRLVALGFLASLAGAVRDDLETSPARAGDLQSSNNEHSGAHTELCCCPKTQSVTQSYKAMCFWNLGDPESRGEKNSEGRLMMFLRREKKDVRSHLSISAESLKSTTKKHSSDDVDLIWHEEVDESIFVSELYPEVASPFDPAVRELSSVRIPGVAKRGDYDSVLKYVQKSGANSALRPIGKMGNFRPDGVSAFEWYCGTNINSKDNCAFAHLDGDEDYDGLCYELACKELDERCKAMKQDHFMRTYSVQYLALVAPATGRAISQNLEPSVCLTSEDSGNYFSHNPGSLSWGLMHWWCPPEHNLKECSASKWTTNICAIDKQIYGLGKDKCIVSETQRKDRMDERVEKWRMIKDK